MMKENTDEARLNSLSSVFATFLNSESKKSTLRFDPIGIGKIMFKTDVNRWGACLEILELSTRSKHNEHKLYE